MTTKATPIEQAWAEVKADFELNLIPNEATLQAALYRALRSHFEGARVVCGVAAIPGEGKRQYPDLMVIKDEKVVAAIEVKVPSREGRVPGLPNYRADVRKLHGLIAAKATVDFHATWLEAGAPRPLARFNDDTCCYFACVGRYDSEGICQQDVERKCAAYLPRNFRVLSLCPSKGSWAQPA